MSLPNFKLRKPDDESDRKLLADIDKFGWHVTHILADDVGPSYSFTVGLYYTYHHPELLIMGFGHPKAHQILTDATAEISKGTVLKSGTRSDVLFEGFECLFAAIRPENYRDYLGHANWFYQPLKGSFPALQILWPDKAGKFPNEKGFDAQLRHLQVIL